LVLFGVCVLAGVAAGVFMVSGCAGKQEPVTPVERVHVVKSSAECTILAVAIASTEPTCADVKKGLAGLLKSSPECAEIYTGNSAFNVHCPEGT